MKYVVAFAFLALLGVQTSVISVHAEEYVWTGSAERVLAQTEQASTESGDEQSSEFTLPEVTVEEEKAQGETRGYIADDSTTATKTETPILLTPYSIEVIDQQLMKDQNTTRLADALRNVSGVLPTGTYRNLDNYRIRGFDASYNTFLDGMPIDRHYWISEETYGLERIEVLKGPSSAIYGYSPVGGLINLISKRPIPRTFANMQVSLGNYDYAEIAADFGGPLDKNGILLGRMNLVYRNTGSWVDFIEPMQRFYAAPSLTINLGPKTSLTFLTQILNDDGNFEMPLPAQGTVLSNPNGKLPISRNIGEPGWENTDENTRVLLGYEFVHLFNEIFSFQSKFRYGYFDNRFRGIYPDFYEEDLATLNRSPWKATEDYWTITTDNYGTAQFTTWEIDHQVLVGADYFYYHSEYFAEFSTISPLNLYDPVYGAKPDRNFVVWNKTFTTQNQTGVYIQEQAILYDKISLVAGGRWDFVWTDSHSVTFDTKDDSFDDKFSPRVGLAYEFYPGVSVYANFAQSFFPQEGFFDANGNAISPETGTEYEAGLKTLLFQGRVQSTLAVYHLTKKNVAFANPEIPGTYITTGKQRSQGVEVDVALNILRGWNLIGAYAYTDSEILKDSTAPKGTPGLNVPKNALSIWTTYFLQTGVLRGLGAGLGGQYYSKQSGDFLHTFDLPAYHVFQAAAYYTRGPLRLQVNIENLTDERYFPGSFSEFYIDVGEPFTITGQIGVSF